MERKQLDQVRRLAYMKSSSLGSAIALILAMDISGQELNQDMWRIRSDLVKGLGGSGLKWSSDLCLWLGYGT